jgi:hypothetical protein
VSSIIIGHHSVSCQQHHLTGDHGHRVNPYRDQSDVQAMAAHQKKVIISPDRPEGIIGIHEKLMLSDRDEYFRFPLKDELEDDTEYATLSFSKLKTTSATLAVPGWRAVSVPTQ